MQNISKPSAAAHELSCANFFALSRNGEKSKIRSCDLDLEFQRGSCGCEGTGTCSCKISL